MDRTLAAAVAAFAIVSSAAPANAVKYGSFPWEVKIKTGLDSRKWTQIDGSTTISGRLPCWNQKVDEYTIELFRNEFLDDSYGKKKFACGTTVSRTWTKLPKGTYHFHIGKATDGISVSGSGSVKYPSS